MGETKEVSRERERVLASERKKRKWFPMGLSVCRVFLFETYPIGLLGYRPTPPGRRFPFRRWDGGWMPGGRWRSVSKQFLHGLWIRRAFIQGEAEVPVG